MGDNPAHNDSIRRLELLIEYLQNIWTYLNRYSANKLIKINWRTRWKRKYFIWKFIKVSSYR